MTVVVEAGPFNGPDDADSVMTWVDITGYVNDNLQPPTSAVGRQTELDQVNPGAFSLILNNRDHRFTPGNVTSPYFPGWRTGMRLRERETIGYQSFTHFDGNMLQPDMTIQTADLDQTVMVNATDRLGRLAQGRKFISTLAEYIIYNGGSLLKAYYPLNDPKAPLRDFLGAQPTFSPQYAETSLAGSTSSVGGYTLNGGNNPIGDDTRGVLFSAAVAANGDINSLAKYWQLYGNFQSSKNVISIAAGVPVTFVMWVQLDSTLTDLQTVLQVGITDASLVDLPLFRLRRESFHAGTTNTGCWAAGIFDLISGLTGTAVGPRDGGSQLMPVGAQLTFSPNSLTLWVDSSEFTAVPAGSLSALPAFLNANTWVGPMSGSVSHLQIYLGSYTRAMFLAQRSAGYDGLAGQYTGQRIATIAQYAGMASGDTEIDTGTSRMQKASLAGKSPLDVMQEAATTEQGLLHAAGRRLLFHDRPRRYNR